MLAALAVKYVRGLISSAMIASSNAIYFEFMGLVRNSMGNL